MNSLKGKGLSGIVNLGNTCFMNSAIQCMSNVHDLTKYFIFNEYKQSIKKDSKRYELLENWVRLMKGLWENNCIVSPVSFHKNIRKIAYNEGYLNFTGFGQNDTQEFLILLIDSLHEALAKPVNITITGEVKNDLDRDALQAYKTWKNHFKNDYSKIVELFYGQFYSEISLNNNGFKESLSKNFDPVCYLNLPIPMNKANVNIYDCFDLFTTDEILDGDNKYQHPKTKELVEATKSIKFWKFPDILILSFKRFNNNRQKINTLIDFPVEDLVLDKYLRGYEKNASFNLIGISNHTGGSGGGHYYSYCLGENGFWYEFNDTNVNKKHEKDIITSNAYVLFYKKIKNKKKTTKL